MGKSIGRWFNDALGVESGSSQEVACLQAFLEMEGNALPFLIRRVDARVSSFDRLYARAMSHMPNGVWDALPSPRTEGYYANRLHSESKNEKNGMVFSLGLLGSNAAPFLPEIKRFAEDPGYAYPWTPKKLCDKYRLPLND